MKVPELFNTKRENFELKILLCFSIVFLIISIFGLTFDNRILNYSPLWLKPFKFALSSILYAITLIYFSSLIPKQKFLKVANFLTSYGLMLELIIIYLQAYRGRMSHFNFLTIEDMILFQTMAFAIIMVWMSLLVYIFAFIKMHSNQNLLIPAIRIGLLITFFSMGMAFTMTSPSEADIEKANLNKGLIGLIMGSHGVRETDETKSLPLTSWARTGGDLRIAHFIGLHAIQLIPFLGFIFFRMQLKYKTGVWIINSFGILYLGIVLFTLFQALNGIPLFPN